MFTAHPHSRRLRSPNRSIRQFLKRSCFTRCPLGRFVGGKGQIFARKPETVHASRLQRTLFASFRPAVPVDVTVNEEAAVGVVAAVSAGCRAEEEDADIAADMAADIGGPSPFRARFAKLPD